MSVAESEKDSMVDLHLVSLDPDQASSGQGIRTVYSVVWTAKTLHEKPVQMYLGNHMGVCSGRNIKECAVSITVETDKWVSTVRRWVPDSIEKEK
ncbi:hypothetical protein [Lysobacter brunescens]